MKEKFESINKELSFSFNPNNFYQVHGLYPESEIQDRRKLITDPEFRIGSRGEKKTDLGSWITGHGS